MGIDWPEFVRTIHQYDRFLLTSHIRPDCDALGSELGMAGILESLGKDVRIVNGHATPPNLQFLDPDRKIQAINEDVSAEQLSDRQLLMILDTSAWAQLGPMSEVVKSTSAERIILDHHVSQDDLGARAFKDTTSEATGRLVTEAAKQLGVKLTAPIATALYAAIATDTGWFRFPSVTPATYRCIAELMEAGASPPQIYGDLYEQETLGRSRLRGVILSRLQTELDGTFVHTYVLKEDFANTGALPQDTEDAINLSLAIAGTKFAVILVEQLTGGFKLSFRSRCHLESNVIAGHFGGGGHKAAAGAFINAPFEQAQKEVLDYVRQQLQS
ncbi:MAG: DHH family phosphoesterase [Planctomycetales bacterium]|nr:DHH family phosphoesterase [Planctomycetales bacterium]